MGRENCSDAKIMELHTHANVHAHAHTRTKMDQETLAHAPTDSCTHNRPVTQLSAKRIGSDRFVFGTADSTLNLEQCQYTVHMANDYLL